MRFDPRTSRFRVIRLPTQDAAVRQLLGRRGELWGAESGTDKLIVVRTGQAAPDRDFNQQLWVRLMKAAPKQTN